MNDEISFREEDEESIGVIQEEEASNNMTEGFSYAGQRIRSKKDNMTVILAKRTAERTKLIEKIQNQNEEILNAKKCEDEIDLFFKSLAITVKKLPRQGIIEAKLRALTLVSELEEKYSHGTSPQQVFDDNYIQTSTPSTSLASDNSQGFTTYNIL